ncbi:uncharacterized protein YndB with AHSA1/START domain [Mucilaginibacter yixingensis]|uniref:Uncharacterized protein YndB with AHSA1/START domain n=1 Tax=Mucilaginibacter yixingensis TaxID=1295612 RepID=A0A2T5JCP5_9SPHI|nr:SRPBCC domain-containing protein [Mucilaginibacter yixingensis]PTQ99539.1 uncharacterized protein YndB with AHSA1/START domain [Mucilaginibacter yixingensis]
MNTEIVKDANNKQLHVTREFAAPVEKVWKAWTEPELLDKWWAPRPWRTETKTMDFSEGGAWLYSMVGPEGERHWCRADYKSITPGSEYSAVDAFCDENGTPSGMAPSMSWHLRFSSTATGTRVDITITFEKEEDLEAIVKMGFKEGFTMAHGNLDELLAQL